MQEGRRGPSAGVRVSPQTSPQLPLPECVKESKEKPGGAGGPARPFCRSAGVPANLPPLPLHAGVLIKKGNNTT
ncbi:hypothetical protein KDA_09080 [Dictyobacter alpinus]|uniref:Uncharacterized protein n=1 Tax=Dictyobacter alpinus TaxID=2014873 RepID=A0A402B246_9CHLR|nr:hypothetical protein KDA_09080 [Dictyobacter alpinus]